MRQENRTRDRLAGIDRMTDAATPPLPALFAAAASGDAASATALFTALYGELHRIASRELHRHGWGVSFGVTSLLHDA